MDQEMSKAVIKAANWLNQTVHQTSDTAKVGKKIVVKIYFTFLKTDVFAPGSLLDVIRRRDRPAVGRITSIILSAKQNLILSSMQF
jgi:hypothetical protein